MGDRRSLTIPYSCVQAPYWMSMCVFMGFTAVYLQYLGYDNTETGMVLASGTLLGSLLGPCLASLIDRSVSQSLSAAILIPPVLAAEAAALFILVAFPVKGAVTSAVYSVFIAVSTSVNTLNLRLYTDAVHRGLQIDFGIARGIGSIGYVLASFVLGFLCESISEKIIPAAGIVICAMQLIAFLNFRNHLKRNVSEGGCLAVLPESSEKASSILTFLTENRRFSLILLGTVLAFYSHGTLCSFFINVVENVGGGVGDLGILNGLMALFETPVVLLYTRLTKRWRTSSVLRFAFIMFTLKAAAVAAAGSVTALGAALVLQAPSFGLYTGAIVLYADEIIAHEDSAKAQSLAFTVTMIANMLASVVAGRQLDVLSVSTVLWIACAVCAAGSAVACLGVRNTADRQK
ncbi:MAG: MFS transporter [Mogibacterium sp.]|nr:MFS transporter [Mogibacterium sp.]